MSDPTRDGDKRQLPPWLLGLILAAILFLLGLLVFNALGFGDDPALEQILIPNALGPVYRLWGARNERTPLSY